MRAKSLLSILLLLLVAAGSWWLNQQTPTATQNQSAIWTEARGVDYYMEQVSQTTMDIDGRPLRKLKAERLTHYQDDSGSALTRPDLSVIKQDQPLWKIRSETGWLSDDHKELLLHGAVTAVRKPRPEHTALHILTRNLRVQPKTNYAETDESVTITGETDTTHAIGMQAWFNQPAVIRLLSKVRGRHEAN